MSYLVAIGGHTGTGKTTLAYGLRRTVICLSEAVILDNDQVRREVLGADLKTVLQDKDYTPEVSAHVLDVIAQKTKESLLQKIPVINCSGFFFREEREALPALAVSSGAKLIGIWLVAPQAVMRERITKRLSERAKLETLSLEDGHASDACHGVIDKFGDIGVPEGDEWTILDASISADTLRARASLLVAEKL